MPVGHDQRGTGDGMVGRDGVRVGLFVCVWWGVWEGGRGS